MHGWQANIKRTCAPPEKIRAMPENEKPRAMRVDIYIKDKYGARQICKAICIDKQLSIRINQDKGRTVFFSLPFY